jgi:hypothetical protein
MPIRKMGMNKIIQNLCSNLGIFTLSYVFNSAGLSCTKYLLTISNSYKVINKMREYCLTKHVY